MTDVLLVSPSLKGLGGIPELTRQLAGLSGGQGGYVIEVIAPRAGETGIIDGLRLATRTYFRARKSSTQIVHAVTWRVAVPALLARRRGRPALVVHCLGSELLRTGPFTRWLRDAVLARATSAVAISNFTAGVIRPLRSGPTFVVPPCAPTTSNVTRIQRAPAVRRSVLSVARFQPRKGHVKLLHAVDEVRRRGLDIGLDIAGGTGPDLQRVRDTIHELQADWATIHVDIGAGELEELYSKADVFALLTSDEDAQFEGFGIVFLEAAARGIPSLALRSGGVGDAVVNGVTGFVIDRPDEVVSALVSLCSDEQQWDRMSDGAITWAALHDGERIGRRIRSVYAHALRSSQVGGG